MWKKTLFRLTPNLIFVQVYFTTNRKNNFISLFAKREREFFIRLKYLSSAVPKLGVATFLRIAKFPKRVPKNRKQSKNWVFTKVFIQLWSRKISLRSLDFSDKKVENPCFSLRSFAKTLSLNDWIHLFQN